MGNNYPDPAQITRHLRAKAGSHLLIAAVHHIPVFEMLSDGPVSFRELQKKLDLEERPAMVLFPALCAMGLLKISSDSVLELTELGNFLVKGSVNDLTGYSSLEKDDPGALRMVEWLRNDGPADNSKTFSYVKDKDADSPMDEPQAARFFTMALAGRAKYLSPIVAANITKKQGHLLDVAGGTGYYSFEWLLANPGSTATLFDTPEVLKVAKELLEEFCAIKGAHDIKARLSFREGDMLSDKLPETDILLAASLFHDWPVGTCEMLAKKFAGAIRTGGEIWIHDSFLNDSLDGPLPVTDYSALLFLGTKGRCYSKKEYRSWLTEAGLNCSSSYIPTLMDYGLISASKP